ncbi:hypothetical protein BDW62DRAFT_180925 [Aspergillus aurantiobrunneus]
MAPRLLNKVCIITGTGGSMGRAAALKFAEEGAIIVGCDMNTANEAKTVEAVKAVNGEIVSLAPCDLTKQESCEQVVNLAIERYGRIDVLYNNASMAYFDWMDNIENETWYSTIDQELNLVYLLTRAAWPHLKRTMGAIINVGSINAWIGVAPLPAIAHVAAKGGIVAMTRQLAMEGREAGIRVNSISPGVVETLQTAPFIKDRNWSDSMLRKVMLGRFAQPEEIVAVASFLASSEASYITATDIKVDGGMTAW